MRLKKIQDTEKFFHIVNECRGRVELVSNEGDRLNLKSKLTQMIAVAKVFSNPNAMAELELVCSDQDDMEKFSIFRETESHNTL